MKTIAKIHFVCQIGLGKPLWARVFKVCCCNSDNCERYCDQSWSRSNFRDYISCNSDNCERYCDFHAASVIISASGVATAITASGIVIQGRDDGAHYSMYLLEKL